MAMGMKLYAGKIPWDDEGPMAYPQDTIDKYQRPDGTFSDNWEVGVKAIMKGPEWKDNVPFEATMTFIAMARGRSAACFILEDENGIKYQMFMSDALDLIQSCQLTKGTVFGTWAFSKKGSNYGLVRAKKKLK